ncbi:threonine ammonia-lyase [Heliobacterium chlorum]|uniref:L-threonine dehydratase catabolic TdcB n=1 Tax=Heliobacterium chlorum TaxID=2698 RepID=A0ABR7T2H8_HELCL|nr:threonine ammonia-lyase [Heliobacterium chlorum]
MTDFKEISFEDIQRAAQRLEGKLHLTPLEHSQTFSRLSGCEVWLKCENLQRTGSFKIRGALNRMFHLTEEEKKRGVIAASAGNHAQGVALGASLIGVASTVVMPTGAPMAKVEATRDYGANVVLSGNNYDEAYQKAQSLREQSGAVFIHAFDDPKVIAGQGTLAIEILKQFPDMDKLTGIVVPVGGGGLIGGLAMAVKSLHPKVRIVGVQTESAPAMAQSLEHHSHRIVACRSTIADGIAVACPGDLTFRLVNDFVDEIVTIDDETIAKTMVMLLERSKLVVEGSGAIGLSALIEGKVGRPGERWVAMLSGGNIDVSAIAQIIEHGLVESGRRWEFRTILPDKPGSLQNLLSEVAFGGANIISVVHDRLRPGLSLSQAEVSVALETRDAEHIQKIRHQFEAKGFRIIDV